MKDSQQNELKIGDRCTVEVVVEHISENYNELKLLIYEGFSIGLPPSFVTRIPDDPKPYTPDPSLFAAPVQGSKPEEA